MANRGKTNVQRIFNVVLKITDRKTKSVVYIPTTIIAESRKMLYLAIKVNASRNATDCTVKLHSVSYEGRIDTYQ